MYVYRYIRLANVLYKNALCRIWRDSIVYVRFFFSQQKKSLCTEMSWGICVFGTVSNQSSADQTIMLGCVCSCVYVWAIWLAVMTNGLLWSIRSSSEFQWVFNSLLQWNVNYNYIIYNWDLRERVWICVQDLNLQ